MRAGRRQHQRQHRDRLVPRSAILRPGLARAPQRVRVLHERRDHRVEAQPLDVAGDPGERLVRLLPQHASLHRVAAIDEYRRLGCHCPGPVQPARHADDAVDVVGPALLPRAQEHQVGAEGVGAPALHLRVGRHHVAARLRHAAPVRPEDLPLAEVAGERLVARHHARVARRLVEEARVEQVHRGVLGAAGVLVDR